MSRFRSACLPACLPGRVDWVGLLHIHGMHTRTSYTESNEVPFARLVLFSFSLVFVSCWVLFSLASWRDVRSSLSLCICVGLIPSILSSLVSSLVSSCVNRRLFLALVFEFLVTVVDIERLKNKGHLLNLGTWLWGKDHNSRQQHSR